MRRVALNVVDQAGLTSLKEDVEAAVDCHTVTTAILGGEAALEISISEWSYSINAVKISGACDATQTLVGSQVLGLFAVDSGVSVGGILSYTLGDVVTLGSEDGFGGVINVAPKAIAPKIAVTFTAIQN